MHSVLMYGKLLYTFYILFAPVSAVGLGLTYNLYHAMEWNKSNYAETSLQHKKVSKSLCGSYWNATNQKAQLSSKYQVNIGP